MNCVRSERAVEEPVRVRLGHRITDGEGDIDGFGCADRAMLLEMQSERVAAQVLTNNPRVTVGGDAGIEHMGDKRTDQRLGTARAREECEASRIVVHDGSSGMRSSGMCRCVRRSSGVRRSAPCQSDQHMKRHAGAAREIGRGELNPGGFRPDERLDPITASDELPLTKSDERALAEHEWPPLTKA